MKEPDQHKNRYQAEALETLAAALLVKAGLNSERARVVGSILTEADLLGHTTHGLALLPMYLREVESGGMATNGEPAVIRDSGAAICWDGNYLPGPWLVHKAIALAQLRISEHPAVTVVIQKSHHIACLAAYLEPAARNGHIIILSCSDPMNKTVAPFGGLDPVYSPNPIAAGWPTQEDPVLFDISMSATANGLVAQKHKAGERLPHPWLLDAQGTPTDDPAAFFENPPATILPLGGLDTGYKGFALGLLVEALTNGLSGFGRSDEPKRWGASVFLQLLNPEAFGGLDFFKKEMTRLAQACLGSQPMPNGPGVRLPGSKALALKKVQLEQGIALLPAVWQDLKNCAERYDLKMPDALRIRSH